MSRVAERMARVLGESDSAEEFARSVLAQGEALHEVIGLIKQALAKSRAKRAEQARQASWQRHAARMLKAPLTRSDRSQESHRALERQQIGSSRGPRSRTANFSAERRPKR